MVRISTVTKGDQVARPPGRPARIAFRPVSLASGDHDGTGTTPAGLGLASARGVRVHVDPFTPSPVPRRFAHACWTSPQIEPGFAFDELVATWHARTPGESWIEVSARARSVGSAGWSRWLVLARWADHDSALHPTSVLDESCDPRVSSDTARVATDTLLAPGGADAWQLRVTLLRLEEGTVGNPELTYVGAMVSSPRELSNAPSVAGPAAGRALDVPALSQHIHAGHYPEWGGGGEVWCSPTSVAMMLAFWGTGPDSAAISWVPCGYPDRPVYHAVRHCWDHAYRGAGNWSFNVAYAARFGLRSFVTRLRDLTEVEAFIAAGIPLVASLQVNPADLAGAEYTSRGHLMVVTGFTATGDVVVNDPAAKDLATLRRVYRRGEFERAWLAGSGGIVYIIHPPAATLPQRPADPNW